MPTSQAATRGLRCTDPVRVLAVAHLLLVLGCRCTGSLRSPGCDDGYGSHFDGNIGASLITLPIMILGFPWTLAFYDNDDIRTTVLCYSS